MAWRVVARSEVLLLGVRVAEIGRAGSVCGYVNKEEKNFSYSKKVAVRSENVAKHGGQVARQVGLCVL